LKVYDKTNVNNLYTDLLNILNSFTIRTSQRFLNSNEIRVWTEGEIFNIYGQSREQLEGSSNGQSQLKNYDRKFQAIMLGLEDEKISGKTKELKRLEVLKYLISTRIDREVESILSFHNDNFENRSRTHEIVFFDSSDPSSNAYIDENIKWSEISDNPNIKVGAKRESLDWIKSLLGLNGEIHYDNLFFTKALQAHFNSLINFRNNVLKASRLEDLQNLAQHFSSSENFFKISNIPTDAILGVGSHGVNYKALDVFYQMNDIELFIHTILSHDFKFFRNKINDGLPLFPKYTLRRDYLMVDKLNRSNFRVIINEEGRGVVKNGAGVFYRGKDNNQKIPIPKRRLRLENSLNNALGRNKVQEDVIKVMNLKESRGMLFYDVNFIDQLSNFEKIQANALGLATVQYQSGQLFPVYQDQDFLYFYIPSQKDFNIEKLDIILEDGLVLDQSFGQVFQSDFWGSALKIKISDQPRDFSVNEFFEFIVQGHYSKPEEVLINKLVIPEEKLLQITSEMKISELENLAEKIEEVLYKTPLTSGTSRRVSFFDIQEVIKRNAEYIQVSEDVEIRQKKGADFLNFKEYINADGIICWQCSGAYAFSDTFFRRYAEISGEDTFITPVRGFMYDGKDAIDVNSYHVQSLVTLPRGNGRNFNAILDLTPQISDRTIISKSTIKDSLVLLNARKIKSMQLFEKSGIKLNVHETLPQRRYFDLLNLLISLLENEDINQFKTTIKKMYPAMDVTKLLRINDTGQAWGLIEELANKNLYTLLEMAKNGKLSSKFPELEGQEALFKECSRWLTFSR
jgi:hypothetical protein